MFSDNLTYSFAIVKAFSGWVQFLKKIAGRFVHMSYHECLYKLLSKIVSFPKSQIVTSTQTIVCLFPPVIIAGQLYLRYARLDAFAASEFFGWAPMLMDLCPPTFASDVCKVQIAIRYGRYLSLIIIDVDGLQTDTKWKFDKNNCPRLHLHLISFLLNWSIRKELAHFFQI